MGTIAKGKITLSQVNDAYTVLLTPASCVINADYDGSNPKLQNALTTLIIKRGNKTVPFSILGIAKSSASIGVSYSAQQSTSTTIKLLGISKSELDGWIDITFKTADGFDFTSTVRFNFSVVRETSMLDWILDWEGSKTKVGGTYIMTPKLFVGHKDSIVHAVEQKETGSGVETYEWTEDALTGVYIGPDLLGVTQTIGLYGYFQSQEIFHLNAEGGMIGGWLIGADGISKQYNTESDKFSSLEILSEGTLKYTLDDHTVWALYKDGTGILAKGNITWKSDGSATFKGKITAQEGEIGGWVIGEKHLISGCFVLDSDDKMIGVINQLDYNYTNGVKFIQDVALRGGVYVFYT